MSTITVQLGNYSNFVASHLWNLQESVLSEDVSEQDDVEDYTTLNLYKCTERKGGESRVPRTVLLDLRENIIGLSCKTDAENSATSVPQSIWGGALKTVERPNHSHVKPDWSVASQTSPSSGSHYWSDFLQSNLHAKSYCEMPLWTNRLNFDTFFAGQSADLVPPDVREDLMDRVRYFAEECDNLQCLRVFADIHDGFSAIACSAVEELRDEYTSAAIPVWAFVEPFGQTVISKHGEAPTASSSLKSLAAPLVYSKLCEDATVVIPIGCMAQSYSQYIRTENDSPYQTSAAIALAIETAEGYRHLVPQGQGQDEGRTMGPKEWCHAATRAGRLPFCSIEAGFYPLGSGTLDPLMESFTGSNFSFSTLNPFLKSLSAAAHGSWSVPHHTHVRTGRAFSNLLSIRGPIIADISQMLYTKCLNSPYLITACFHRQTPLLLSNSFPSIFSGLSKEGTTNNAIDAFNSSSESASEENILTRVERCSFMASVGCDSRMGKHVGRVADTWENMPHACRAQLDKVGYGGDECREVSERLTDLKFRYEPSSDS